MTTSGSETTTPGAAAAAEVDWTQMEAWDRAYYLHNVQGAEEHVWNGVAYQEGNYLYMVDGSRLLDCQSQLISDNMGHRHPKVVDGLRRALDCFADSAHLQGQIAKRQLVIRIQG